jgi:hypothetical protein
MYSARSNFFVVGSFPAISARTHSTRQQMFQTPNLYNANNLRLDYLFGHSLIRVKTLQNRAANKIL